MNRHYPVIIIGAGQAGLVMGYLLKRAGVQHLIVGKEKRVGDVWRNRYDSLLLFTPRWMNRLPGCRLNGQRDMNGYPDKHEIADELEAYAAIHGLNVELDTEVGKMRRREEKLVLETNRGVLTASQAVIATGPFQTPSFPDFADMLSPQVVQVHAAHYRNRKQLQDGNVLIVGSGNSGAQIAVELAEHHQVHVSASRTISFVPQEILGKSIFWWFQRLGVYKANVDTTIGRRLCRRADPVIGKALQACIRSGKVALHPRTVSVKGDQAIFEQGTRLGVSNVIWATGYTSDYRWLQVPGALNESGRPIHVRGVSKASGVYFLGLPWQYNRASALIGGVAADASYLLQKILETANEKNAAGL